MSLALEGDSFMKKRFFGALQSCPLFPRSWHFRECLLCVLRVPYCLVLAAFSFSQLSVEVLLACGGQGLVSYHVEHFVTRSVLVCFKM